MKVIVSTRPRSEVWHMPGCACAKRIHPENREILPKRLAAEAGYRVCRCCGNLRGAIRATGSSLQELSSTYHMELTCRPDGLYARTVNGFWKILWIEGAGLLLLHRNRFEPDKTTEEMAPGPYHRQKDVKVTDCLAKLLYYIEQHDKAKSTAQGDYRRLPQRTNREKKYYKAAERRERSREIRRVYDLFAMLEAEREQPKARAAAY